MKRTVCENEEQVARLIQTNELEVEKVFVFLYLGRFEYLYSNWQLFGTVQVFSFKLQVTRLMKKKHLYFNTVTVTIKSTQVEL